MLNPYQSQIEDPASLSCAAERPSRTAMTELMRTVALIFIAILVLSSTVSLVYTWGELQQSSYGTITTMDRVANSVVPVVVLISVLGFCIHYEWNKRKKKVVDQVPQTPPELKQSAMKEIKKIGLVLGGMFAVLVLCGVLVWATM